VTRFELVFQSIGVFLFILKHHNDFFNLESFKNN